MRASRRSARGQSTVEIVLSISLFLVLVMGAIDFGRYLYIRTTLLADAQDAARQLSLLGNKTTDCPAFTAGLNQGGGITLQADPNAWSGGGAATPSGSIPANTGFVYLSPAVGAANPYPANCSGGARAAGAVQARITYKLTMLTPFLSALIPSLVVTVSAQDQTEY